MSKAIKVSSDHRPYARAGYALILFGLGGFVAWASMAQIAAAVVAPGTVAVVSNRKVVQHLEGGIVDMISVRDGSKVAAGDVLVRLDSTRAQAELDALSAQLDAGMGVEARLEAEKEGLDAIAFPDSLLARAGESGTLKMMESQRQLFDARKHSSGREVEMLESRIESLNKKAAAYRKQVKNLNAEIASYQEQLAGISSLASQGYASKNSERDFDRRILSLETAIGESEAEIATAESAIAEASLQKVMVDHKLREEAMTELVKVREANAELLERIAVAKDVLSRTDIKAPQDGVVQGLRFHAKGAVIGPGDPLLELVPVQDDLVVETQLPSVSIDQVHAGMVAEIRFPSFSSRQTPILLGKVSSVSPDALPDAEGNRMNFVGRVEVLEETIPEELVGRLQPGMPAEVIIPTEERTVMSYLLKPLTDAVAKTFRER